MDNEFDIQDDNLIISNQLGKKKKLDHNSAISNRKPSDADEAIACETAEYIYSQKTSNSSTAGRNEINSMFDVNDSFEIFLPLKKSISEKSNLSTKQVHINSKLKLKNKTRSCPYFSTKNIKDHFKSPLKSKEDKDLELAIQRSLQDVPGCSTATLEETSHSATIHNKVTKIESVLKLQNWTNKRDRKKKINSLLSRRTSYDREKIITQKVAIVLLETKENQLVSSIRNIELCSTLLEELLDKNSTLWELSKVDGDLEKFYVSSLSNFIEPLQLPKQIPEKTLEVENTEVPNPTVSSQNSVQINSIKTEGVRNSQTMWPCSEEFPSKQMPLYVLSDNWSRLFESGEHSDIHIKTSTNILPCHRLVLFVRCPSILEELTSASTNIIDFSKYSSNTVKVFFSYIYSGKTEGISSLTKDEKKDIQNLSSKYNLTCLHSAIIYEPYNESLNSMETQSPPHRSPHVGSPSFSTSFKNTERNFNERGYIINDSPIYLSDCSSDSDKTQPYPAEERAIFTKDKSSDNLTNLGFIGEESTSPDLTECKLRSNSSKVANKDNLSGLLAGKNSGISNKEIVTIDLDSNDSQTNCDCNPPQKNNSFELPLIVGNSTSDSPSHQGINRSIINLNLDLNSTPNIDIRITGNNNNYQYGNELKSCTTPPSVRNDNVASPQNYTFCFSPPQANNVNKTIPQNYKSLPSIASTDALSTPKTFMTTDLRSSLNQYLETSFPSMSLLDDFQDKQLLTPKSSEQSTPHATVLVPELPATPIQEIIFKDASPNNSFSEMSTPELKRELSKFGLKTNLTRQKANAILQYIKEQILLQDEPLEATPCTSKGKRKTPVKRGKNSSPKKSTEESGFEIKEEEVWRKFSSPNDELSDHLAVVSKFLKTNIVLYRSIIQFQQISLQNLNQSLSNHGFKYSLQELKFILDELAVCYQTEDIPKNRQKRSIKYL